MRTREGLANDQLLTDGHRTLGTYNLQLDQSARNTTLNGDQIGYRTEVDTQTLADQIRQTLLREFLGPTIEVLSLLIVRIEHLRQHLRIGRVAERLRRRGDPLASLLLDGQIPRRILNCCVINLCQIGVNNRLPYILKTLGYTAAALRETCVAGLAIVSNDLTARLSNSLTNYLGRCAVDTLITLAVVISAHVEIGVILTVEPTNILVIGAGLGLIIGLSLLQLSRLLDLCDQPATRDHCVSLQQLQRRGCAHLRRDYAEQIILDIQHIDCGQFLVLLDKAQCATERLILLTLPMEVDTDHYVLQFELGVLIINRSKFQRQRNFTLACCGGQHCATLGQFNGSLTLETLALALKCTLQAEADGGRKHNTY